MKSVLITGGCVRLGAAIAKKLHIAGWNVITSSSRADAGADVVADLSEAMGAAKLYAKASEIAGGMLDAIVNNAGLFTGDEEKMRMVNCEAGKKLTIMLAGREGAKERASVVNILDTRILGGSTRNAYEKTKAEMLEWTKKSAMLFADTLRVNAVAPGPVMAPTEVHEAAGEMLIDRPGAEDVAEAVAYLLNAKSTTGTVIPVDGGQHLL